MADPKANLLNFTIHLNRDGNLEFSLDCVNTVGLEQTLRTLGDPNYPYKIGNIVKDYFYFIQDKVKQERA